MERVNLKTRSMPDDRRAEHIELRATAGLIPYARNPRTHSRAQVGQIAASIREFGFTNPILIDEKGGVIAGHGRVLAAVELGLEQVPTIKLAYLSQTQRRAYVIADNQLALNAGWNSELLRLELGELKGFDFDLKLTGFSDLELGEIFADRTAGLTDPDEAPPLPEVPISRTGDLWLLGRHRLLCGDSTKALDVEIVLDESTPHLMVTDPPYGVMLDPSWRDRAGVNKMGKAGAGGENFMASGKADTEARWDEVWALAPVHVFYVWCAGFRLVEVCQALGDADFQVRQFLIWDKGALIRTRSHYWWSHEHCLYGVRKGKTASWVGAPGQSTVWRIPSPKNPISGSKEQNEPHPAQKPVECMRRPIENNSRAGQAVYDPFLGSGTTIIAAEMTGRACLGIEISPAYVDVAVKRWQAFTGQRAVLDGDGRSFDEIAETAR
jgi:DNA modification methylase